MSEVVINGVRISAPPGSNVSVIGNKVFIDGKEVSAGAGGANIQIDVGDAKFTLKCDRDVVVNGGVAGGVVAKGNVSCHNVSGGVETQGDVTCRNVTGGIEGRDVRCSGNVTGGIEARNFGTS